MYHLNLLRVLLTFVVYLNFTWGTNGIHMLALQKCVKNMNGKLPKVQPSDFSFSGNVRRYYVAAEQVKWNYAPTGWDNWMGVPINASTRAALNGYGAPSLGYTWEKALYRGYNDSTFQHYSPQSPTQGAQGPTLRAEVGDMLEILFVNKLAENYASMHSMGLSYSKHNEGSDYPNAEYVNKMAPPLDNALAPGDCVVMKWLVNDGSAPTGNAKSIMWSYHSYVSLQQDTDAGLVGPTIVYSRGEMARTMASHREFTLSYIQYSEADSFLSSVNAKQHGMSGSKPPSVVPHSGHGYGNASIWRPQLTNLATSYQLSTTVAPTFDTLNGLIYANNYPFEVCVNDPTIWYVSAWGSNPHTFHMHGNGFTHQGMNLATISLTPGVMLTLQSTMGGVGAWQLICHMTGHQAGGMMDNYIVYSKEKCPLAKLTK